MAEKRKGRNFIFIAASGLIAVGFLILASAVTGSMGPSAGVFKEKRLTVDLSEIEEGQQKIVLLRGDPILIRHRTAEEVLAAQNINQDLLHHPESDEDRIRSNLAGEKDPRFIILVFLCPYDHALPSSYEFDYEKWFCQYSTARFDSSGRSIGRTEFENMKVPNYRYLSDTTIELVPELTPVERVLQN